MRLRHATARLPSRVADGVEVLAIGDVHGHAVALAALLRHALSLPRLAPRREAVQLGDLIDRGPASLACVELALDGAGRSGSDAWVGLLGDHEVMAREALRTGADPVRRAAWQRLWVASGGDAVLREAATAGMRRVPAVEGRLRRWLDGLARTTRRARPSSSTRASRPARRSPTACRTTAPGTPTPGRATGSAGSARRSSTTCRAPAGTTDASSCTATRSSASTTRSTTGSDSRATA